MRDASMPGTPADPLAGLPIAIVDPAASYRLGLAAALEAAGAEVAEPEDPARWAASTEGAVVLLTISAHAELSQLTELRAAGARVVALLPDPSPPSWLSALREGADGAADWHAPPQDLTRVVRACAEGHVRLPGPIARALAASTAMAPEAVHLDEREIDWLRALAAGDTVSALAARAGYRERAMYRLLRGTYQKIGARTRSEALVRVARWGVLETPADGAPAARDAVGAAQPAEDSSGTVISRVSPGARRDAPKAPRSSPTYTVERGNNPKQMPPVEMISTTGNDTSTVP